MFILLGTAVWWWQVVRFPAAERPLAGTPITLRVQDGLGERDVAAFTRGLRAGDRFLEASTGRALRGPVDARLAFGDRCATFGARPGRGPTGIADDNFLCIDARVPWWRPSAARGSAVAASVAAHELVHVWQAENGCLPGPGDHKLLWLVEGTATDFSWRAMVATGTVDERDVARQIGRMGALNPRVPALKTFERRGGGDPEYALWYLAVRDLERRSGRPAPRALAAMCDAIDSGTSWREAFARSYGLPVERFYAEFEATRPALRRSLERAGRIPSPGGVAD